MTITNRPTKIALLLRSLVAVYVLYVAFGLVKDYGTSENRMLSMIAIVVFVAGGGLILISSLRRLATGDYDDGTDAGETALPDESGHVPDVQESASQGIEAKEEER